jgi:hypothetical protein
MPNIKLVQKGMDNMKIRNGFVSNSSSSSFIIATNNKSVTREDIINILKKSEIDMEQFYRMIADKIFNELQDIGDDEWQKGLKEDYPNYERIFQGDIEGGGDGGDALSNFIRDYVKVDYDNGFIKAVHDGSF